MIDKYELIEDVDYYFYKDNPNKTVITKSGIQKIRLAEQIEIELDLKQCTNQQWVVVHAKAFKANAGGLIKAESFGTVNPKNHTFNEGFGWYGVELAEKRAEQRVVLKIIGTHNTYGEDEFK